MRKFLLDLVSLTQMGLIFMLLIGMHYELGALTLTVIMTAVFTLTAIVRKVIVRLHFHKKQTKNLV